MILSECNYLWSNCPGAIIRGQSSRGQLSGGQYSSGAIILGGNCPGAIIQGAIVRGAIFLGGNCPDTGGFYKQMGGNVGNMGNMEGKKQPPADVLQNRCS